jgi:hypothetical protein
MDEINKSSIIDFIVNEYNTSITECILQSEEIDKYKNPSFPKNGNYDGKINRSIKSQNID